MKVRGRELLKRWSFETGVENFVPHQQADVSQLEFQQVGHVSGRERLSSPSAMSFEASLDQRWT
jgi:hypothetical protein